MDFNINIKMDKAMNAISKNEKLRHWTYTILVLIIIAIIAWKSPDIINAIANFKK